MSLSEECDRASVQPVVKDIVERREKLIGLVTENIVNVDETGLIYELLTKKTYICKSENRKSV